MGGKEPRLVAIVREPVVYKWTNGCLAVDVSNGEAIDLGMSSYPLVWWFHVFNSSGGNCFIQVYRKVNSC